MINSIAIKFTTKAPSVVSVYGGGKTHDVIPTAYSLGQNYPNPFNPETRISYSLPELAYVKLSIYDINGTLVKTLQDGNQSIGRYELVWNGENSFGIKVGSGVYFYRIRANNFTKVRKMILLK